MIGGGDPLLSKNLPDIDPIANFHSVLHLLETAENQRQSLVMHNDF